MYTAMSTVKKRFASVLYLVVKAPWEGILFDLVRLLDSKPSLINQILWFLSTEYFSTMSTDKQPEFTTPEGDGMGEYPIPCVQWSGCTHFSTAATTLPPAHDYRVMKAEGVLVERFVQAAVISRPAAARWRNIHIRILRGQKRLHSERDLYFTVLKLSARNKK